MSNGEKILLKMYGPRGWDRNVPVNSYTAHFTDGQVLEVNVRKHLRGHSTTTWTNFDPLPPPRVDKCGHSTYPPPVHVDKRGKKAPPHKIFNLVQCNVILCLLYHQLHMN